MSVPRTTQLAAALGLCASLLRAACTGGAPNVASAVVPVRGRSAGGSSAPEAKSVREPEGANARTLTICTPAGASFEVAVPARASARTVEKIIRSHKSCPHELTQATAIALFSTDTDGGAGEELGSGQSVRYGGWRAKYRSRRKHAKLNWSGVGTVFALVQQFDPSLVTVETSEVDDPKALDEVRDRRRKEARMSPIFGMVKTTKLRYDGIEFYAEMALVEHSGTSFFVVSLKLGVH